MTPAYLVTHSGGFHADEVFSTVILTRLYPQAQLIRRRTAEWITPGPTASSMMSAGPMVADADIVSGVGYRNKAVRTNAFFTNKPVLSTLLSLIVHCKMRALSSMARAVAAARSACAISRRQ